MDNPIQDIIRAATASKRHPGLALALTLIAVAVATCGLVVSVRAFWLILSLNVMVGVFSLASCDQDEIRAPQDALGMMLILDLSILVATGVQRHSAEWSLQAAVGIGALGIAVFAFAGQLVFGKSTPPRFADFRDKWVSLSGLVGLALGFVALRWYEPAKAADIASRATFGLAFFGAALLGAAWCGVTAASWLRPTKNPR